MGLSTQLARSLAMTLLVMSCAGCGSEKQEPRPKSPAESSGRRSQNEVRTEAQPSDIVPEGNDAKARFVATTDGSGVQFTYRNGKPESECCRQDRDAKARDEKSRADIDERRPQLAEQSLSEDKIGEGIRV